MTVGAFLGPDLGRDLVAVQFGQGDVEQDQRGLLGAPKAETLGAVGRLHDLVAFLLEGVDQLPLDVLVVVDDEDLGGHQLRSVPPESSKPAEPGCGL